ncbi:MAG: LicD family protein [Treponema sp.]|nr:LicD family protein [Treponema sp.]
MKYKVGYACSSLAHADGNIENFYKALSEQCERFVIGIPSEYVMARIFGGGMNGYNAESVKNHWASFGYEVLVLDKTELLYQSVYEKVHFDVCFYGSEYGTQFEADRLFFKEHGVEFLPALPERRTLLGDGDALKLAIENVTKEQKLILFGTGTYFDVFMKQYGSRHAVAYAVDSEPSKQGTSKAGVPIKSPDELKNESAGNCLVVFCGKGYQAMRDQLASLNGLDYRPMVYANTIALLEEYALACRAEDSYIAQAQAGLMRLLKEFDRVCKKYGLKYYIICGSLIGVIRHKGFIPWDDDMDLAMTWGDYKKLRKAAKKEWKDGDFHLLHYTGLGHGAFLDFMPRFVYMKEYFSTKVYDKVKGKCKPEYENHMFIDIYPMLNASRNQKKHMLVMNIMKGVYNLCMGHRAKVNYSEYARMPEKTVRLMKLINTIGKFFPARFLMKTYEFFANYAKFEKCDEYFMPSCAITCIERKFKKEFFGDGQYMPFNDMQLMIPKDYAGLLEAMGYHGYMNFPPLHIRKPSHYFNSDIEIW